MPDRRKTAQGKSKVIPVETKQKTLLDLFPRKFVSAETLPVNKAPETGPSNHEHVLITAHAEITGTTADKVELSKSQPKPLHPLFTKRPRPSTLNQIQKVFEEDEIIEIPDGESSPGWLPSSGSPSAVSPERCSPQPGGNQEDPIILESYSPRSPLPLPSQSLPSKLPIRPPFLSPVASRIKSSKDKNTDNVPYPDRDSQHVRGPQQIYPAPDTHYSRRQHRRATTSTSHSSILDPNQDMNDTASFTDTMHFLSYTAAGKETYLEEIPSEHSRLHPAISRLVNPDAARPTGSSSIHNAWTDKWRPTRAEEVLGNESNAIYLRDWLSALELHFDTCSRVTPKQDQKTDSTVKAGQIVRRNKRLRVMRVVEKHRGRKKRRIDSDDSNDWIVYSDESEGEVLQADEIDDGIEQAPSRLYRKHSRSDLPVSASLNQFSNHLTNTILLAGPSGAGKTAAIYACADELGWEVFEVYPGIGKRNGASIENMIGDVGKNHLVRKTQHRGGEAIRPAKGHDALDMLSGKRKDLADEQLQDCPSPARDFGFISRSDDQLGQGASGSSTVRQSLILLEEVDILFKEDNNFWPAVTNFIKDCKRPVICTCNDTSLVPTLELPLQTILTFQACPAQVAASYLQGLCSAEGYLVERDSLLGLYDLTCKSTDIPLSSFARVSDFPVPDLRRTINCLQLRCSTIGAIPPSGCIVEWHTEPEYSIEYLSNQSQTRQSSSTNAGSPFPRGSVIGHADLVSFIDSELIQSSFEVSEAFDGFKPSADDELGCTILVPTTGDLFGFRHGDIASTAIRLSRVIFGREIKEELSFEVLNSFQTHALFRARVEHQVQMVKGLKNMIPSSMWAMRNDVIHMDYGPWIRQFMAEEDVQEVLHMKKAHSGRATRNSGGGYVRTMLVTPEEREALVATRLVG